MPSCFNIPTEMSNPVFPGKTLKIKENLDNKFWRACIAEGMAMHMFVLLCCGCAMVTLNLPNPNLMMVAASFGFGILVLAQIFGPLSSAHINCAVSFGLFCAGRTSLYRVIGYTISQLIGSIFGALFLWAIFGNNWPAARAFGSNSWDESVFTGGQVFFAEMLGTMLLMFNVLSTIDIPTGGNSLGNYPIAMSVMIAHLFLLPIDGCSINPTRSFGPAIVAQWANIHGDFAHQQHVFWFGPMFGAGVAACVYEYASLKPANQKEQRDMDTALYGANIRTKDGKTVKKTRKTASKTTNKPVGAAAVKNPILDVEVGIALEKADSYKSTSPVKSVVTAPVKPVVVPSVKPVSATVVKEVSSVPAAVKAASTTAPTPAVVKQAASAPVAAKQSVPVPAPSKLIPIPVAKAPVATTKATVDDEYQDVDMDEDDDDDEDDDEDDDDEDETI